jgi:transposase
MAEKACSHPSTRRALRRRGIAPLIPEERDQRADRRARGSAGGRPPAFDRDRYEQRNVVERCFDRLEQFRALATRYAERAAYYRATLLLVSTVPQLRA